MTYPLDIRQVDHWVVCQLARTLVEGVQDGRLPLEVEGADARGALERHVLQQVRQTCST